MVVLALSLAVGCDLPQFPVERDRPGNVVTVGGAELPFYLLPVRVKTGPGGWVECAHVDPRGVVVLDNRYHLKTEVITGGAVRYRWDATRQREREQYRRRHDVSD